MRAPASVCIVLSFAAACGRDAPRDRSPHPTSDPGVTCTASGWHDLDGDGFGDPASPDRGCTASPDAVDEPGDCDDTRADVNPAGVEACDDGIDNDCDGLVDSDAEGAEPWYADADGDGHGDPATVVWRCVAPDGTTADASDCDDADETVHPGVEEACGDGVDDDCDGEAPGCGMEGTSSLADAPTVLRGEAEGDLLGDAALAGVDLTADGVADLLLTARGVDGSGEARGLIYVLPGGGGLRPHQADLGGAIRIDGLDDYAYTGSTVEAGDFDQDGNVDLVLGTSAAVSAFCWAEDGGSNVVWGPLDGPSPAMMAVCGGTSGLGFQLDASDLTGDGVPDVLLGSEDDFDSGDSYLFLLPGPVRRTAFLYVDDEPGVIRLTADGNRFNWYQYPSARLAASSDLDGDGALDVALGQPDRGFGLDQGLDLFFGPFEADAGPDRELASDVYSAGNAVEAAGDVDLDGVDDLLVGAPEVSHGGEAWIVPGGAAAWDEAVLLETPAIATVHGDTDDDQLGSAILRVGDADGDGTEEIAIGAPGSDRTAEDGGEVFLFALPLAGTVDAADALGRWGGEDPEDGVVAGSSSQRTQLLAGGDVDGDGFADLVVGNPNQSRAGESAGAAYILYGGPGF